MYFLSLKHDFLPFFFSFLSLDSKWLFVSKGNMFQIQKWHLKNKIKKLETKFFFFYTFAKLRTLIHQNMAQPYYVSLFLCSQLLLLCAPPKTEIIVYSSACFLPLAVGNPLQTLGHTKSFTKLNFHQAEFSCSCYNCFILL